MEQLRAKNAEQVGANAELQEQYTSASNQLMELLQKAKIEKENSDHKIQMKEEEVQALET